MSKPLNFILLGRVGCGKGTQDELLMKHFGNLVYISTGDLFRNLTKIETDVGRRVRKMLIKGEYPPEDLAETLWMHEIAHKVRVDQGIIADGFPRRLNEAKNLDRLLEFLERKENTFCFLIDISREEASNRLTKRRICKRCGRLIPWVSEFKNLKLCDKCGGELINRADDTPEAINNRLDFYEKDIVPVVKYYEEQGGLIRIDGEQSIEDVFKDILKVFK